jgi:23S rRNA (adenine2503-C2)-methyltransferase
VGRNHAPRTLDRVEDAQVDERPHILDLSIGEIEARLAEWGQPGYRAAQIARWVLRQGATSFEEMTNLPSELREQLGEAFRVGMPSVLATRAADDGATTKVLLDLGSGDAIESVRMDYDPESDSGDGDGESWGNGEPSEAGVPRRTTVCVSTQAGCAMGCVFCATGQQGFTRNLTPSEIVAQVLYFARERRVTNVVFMGMGEPLANFDAMLRAIHWLVDESGLGMRQRGVTVSTVGLLRPIERLAEERLQLGLTISLHAPNDELRRRLVPTSGAATIDALIEAGLAYQATTGRRVTFAYALLEHVNDEPEHARELAERLRGKAVHVNLVPYNPTAGVDLRRPSNGRVRRFQQELLDGGVNATVRVERGIEIAAACGQLRGALRAATAPRAKT